MELNIDKPIENLDINEAKFVGTLVRDKWGRLYNKINGYITAHIAVKRQSETIDTIPLKISNKVINVDDLKSLEGKEVFVEGKILSFNRIINDKSKLIIMIGVDTITSEIPKDLSTNNYVRLEGRLLKTPTFRQTPLKRYITELSLENKTNNGHYSKIPCICWSKLAVKAAEFEVDTVITVVGRFQSRDYTKKLDDAVVTKTTYELSIQSIDGID